MLANPQGQLQFVAASPESVNLLELFELQSQEGPCLECYRLGVATYALDLDTAEARSRWPSFAERAVRLGLRSAHAFPLRHRDEHVGTIGILQERTIRAGEVLTEQLQAALVSRVSIEQAKGALARSMNIDVDQAFTMLRNYARANNHRLSELARGVVSDPARFPDLTRADPPGP